MSEKLLSCPFCGHGTIFTAPDEIGSGGQWVGPIHVGCNKCKAEQIGDDEPSARANWNRRAALQEQLESAHAKDHANTMLSIQRLSDIFKEEKAAWQVERAKHEAALTEVIRERDEHHDIADKLAQAIADHLLVGIGEHSSANCPWMRALEEIQNAGLCSVFEHQGRLL